MLVRLLKFGGSVLVSTGIRVYCIISCLNERKRGKEERDGTVVRALVSHQFGPDLIPGLGIIRGLSLLLVLILALRGFSPGTAVFPSPQKPTFLNSHLIWNVSQISALR